MRTDRHICNEHQKLLLSMLKDLDAVCKSNGIRYQLFSGTALGAVRHGGFIPWDDDMDVVLLREDYERFLDAAEQMLDSEKYYVQREFSAHWPMQFSKLRRNGTSCMEKYHPRDEKTHQGVYVDIFPCDNLSKSAPVRGLQYLAARAVVAKALYARGYETRSAVKKCFIQLCRLLPRKALWQFSVRAKDRNSPQVHTFFAAGSKYRKNVFPREWFTNTTMMRFEDSEYPVSAHYDALLRKLYGDYHVLPSEEERRCKEHVAILDLEHSYTEHLAEQRKMDFNVLTRSIR